MREVRDILRVAQMPVSLEKPVGDEEESELGDFVADETTEEPFETATENLQREDIQRALDALPERERQVIELRYGLRGHEPLTLEEVGRAFGVTRERIRQIENNTLRKLKQLPEAQRLRELAELAARSPALGPSPGRGGASPHRRVELVGLGGLDELAKRGDERARVVELRPVAGAGDLDQPAAGDPLVRRAPVLSPG